MKKLLLLLMCCGLFGYGEALPDFSQFKDLSSEKLKAKPIVENFDTKPVDWNYNHNVKWTTEGMTGTGCMVAERKTPTDPISANKMVRIIPGVTYRISVNYRSEMVEDHKANLQEVLGFRTYKNGKNSSCGFAMRREPGSKPDWTSMSIVVKAPEDCDEMAKVMLLIRSKRVGKVWYDNLVIEPTDFRSTHCFPVRPFQLTAGPEGEITIFTKVPPKRDAKDFAVLAECGNVRKLLKISNNIAKGKLGKLPAGKQILTLSLVDMAKKEILGKDQSPLFVREVPAQKGAVTIESDGQMIRDGKPFMPVGIFLGMCRPYDRDIFKRVSEAGFNSVQGIGSNLLYHGKKETFLASVQAAVRGMAKYNLGYMYAIKYQLPTAKPRKEELDGVKGLDNVTRYIVNGLKNEPNMLAWYISDENPVNQVPEIRRLRQVISECDPYHPTMTLTDKEADMVDFSMTGDYLMIDNYPVGRRVDLQGENQSMKVSRQHLESGRKTGVPLVWVPQIFAWASFPHSKHLPTRYPTEQEMRSMVLLGTHFNVKAYFFYAYHPIFYYSEQRDPGHSGEQWERVKKAVAILNELVPFLLSREKAPACKVKQVSGSKVLATAFSLEGKNAVTITSDGPGVSVAEIKTTPGLKSRYGKTKEVSPGVYRFEGKNIDSDVLM